MYMYIYIHEFVRIGAHTFSRTYNTNYHLSLSLSLSSLSLSLSPSFRQSLYLPSISHNVLLSTHFCEVIGHTDRVTSDPSPVASRQFGAIDTSHLLNLPLLSTSMLSRSPAQQYSMSAAIPSRSPAKVSFIAISSHVPLGNFLLATGIQGELRGMKDLWCSSTVRLAAINTDISECVKPHSY